MKLGVPTRRNVKFHAVPTRLVDNDDRDARGVDVVRVLATRRHYICRFQRSCGQHGGVRASALNRIERSGDRQEQL